MYLKLVVLIYILFIIGCGVNAKVDPNSKNINKNEEVNVTVERGPVYGAIVKDNKGLIATQVSNKNIYKFSKKPEYPIIVNGGWIDLNNDKIKNNNDIDLDIELKSYSNYITPVTTLLAIKDKDKQKEVEKKISDEFNIDKELLYKLPSNGNMKLAILTNAIYKQIIENNVSINKFYSYENLILNKNNSLINLKNTYNNIKEKAESSDAMENGIFKPLQLENLIINELNNNKNELNEGIIEYDANYEDLPPIPKGTSHNKCKEGISPTLNLNLQISGGIKYDKNYNIDNTEALNVNYKDTSIYYENYVIRDLNIRLIHPLLYDLKWIKITAIPGVEILGTHIENNEYVLSKNKFLSDYITYDYTQGLVKLKIKYNKYLKIKKDIRVSVSIKHIGDCDISDKKKFVETTNEYVFNIDQITKDYDFYSIEKYIIDDELMVDQGFILPTNKLIE